MDFPRSYHKREGKGQVLKEMKGKHMPRDRESVTDKNYYIIFDAEMFPGGPAILHFLNHHLLTDLTHLLKSTPLCWKQL